MKILAQIISKYYPDKITVENCLEIFEKCTQIINGSTIDFEHENLQDIINFRHICQFNEGLLEELSNKDQDLFNKIKTYYVDIYTEISKCEGKLIQRYSTIDPTCFVGCGAIPVSLLIYSKNYDAYVTGIEINNTRTQIAQNFIIKRHKNNPNFDINKITITNCAGEFFNEYPKFKNIIFAASLPEQVKQTVIDKIYKEQLSVNHFPQYIINRSPIGNGRLIYEEDEVNQSDKLQLLDTINTGFLSISILSIKK